MSCTAHSAVFQSTPSAWRETRLAYRYVIHGLISIHSLRMEGDVCRDCHAALHGGISIHSLRMEGDSVPMHFYDLRYISIHSLRMEGDVAMFIPPLISDRISIHSLRMEGDPEE